MEKISLEGLNIKPSDIRLLKNLGEAYFFQNKYAKTVDTFEKYLKYSYQTNDTYLPTLYYYLGYSYLQLKSYYKADIAMSMAQHFKKNNILHYIYLGQINEQLDNKKKAYQFFQTALKMDPNNSTAQEALDRLKDFAEQ
ncbi:MAG: tetratricopeptide repeat protein, partial [Spirochaetes bacterium]|nr:tetratricopeptide repeat protein [Spirochaetota bacterium]